MALFRKPVCENLKKKNKVMAKVDSIDDDATDSLLVYKPKRMKDAGIESLFEDEKTTRKARPYWFKWAVWGGVGILAFLILIIVILNF